MGGEEKHDEAYFRRLLQFNLNLKRLSMTALITHVYEQPDVKEKMKTAIRTNYRAKESFPYRQVKKEIISLASQKIKSLELPQSLISEVQGLLIFFAKKIVSWAEFIIKTFQLDLSCLDRIYWTSIGTIDDAKIFHEYWDKRKGLSEALESDDVKMLGLTMVCKYPREEIILHYQDIIIAYVQRGLKKVKLADIRNKVDQIVASYSCHLYGLSYDKQEGDGIFKTFKKTGVIEISDVLPICRGNPKTIKFLWNYLTDEYKTEEAEVAWRNAYENVRYAIEPCNSLYHEEAGLRSNIPVDIELEMHQLGACAEAIQFLINEIPIKYKKLFLESNTSEIMETFLQIWPYPEICSKWLDEEWFGKQLAMDDHRSEEALYTLLIRMSKDMDDLRFVSGRCHYPSIFHEILAKMLKLFSKEIKEKVLFKKAYHCFANKEFAYAIEKFFYIFDLVALKLIINDKDLQDRREDMIDKGDEKILTLIHKKNFNAVVRFMDEVLASNKERKLFIKKWKLKKFVDQIGDQEKKEKFLGWMKS